MKESWNLGMSFKDNATNQKEKRKRRNPFRYFLMDFIKVTGVLSAAIWIRPKRLFESKQAKKHARGRAVVIANHTSIKDPIALYFALWYRRVHVLAMKEIFETKLGNWFFRKALCVPVDRNNFNMSTFREMSEILEGDGVLAIFPEGAIGREKSTVQSFKSGAALIALKARAPIIPVYIAPSEKRYCQTVMVIGEPIDPIEICGATPSLNAIDELSKKLREKELKLMEIYSAWKERK